jgi:MFS family permease
LRLLGSLFQLTRRGQAVEPPAGETIQDAPGADELRNGLLLRLEGISAGLVFGGLAAFYALYTIQLGGSNAVVGWLTSAPALVSLLWQIPVSRLIPRFRSYRSPIVTGVILHRVALMALAGVVLLPATWRPWGVVALVALAALPSSLWGIAFQAAWVVMFSPSRLAHFVGLRWSFASLVTMASVYGLGVWLDRVAFPQNFQIMFVAGGMISLASVAIMLRFRFPPLQPAAGPTQPATAPRRSPWDWVRLYRSFFILEAMAFIAYAAIYAAMPLFRIYWVRDLGANATWIGLLTVGSSVGNAAGNVLWGRWSHPLRNRRNVLITCLGFAAAYPLLTAAFDSLAPLIVVNILTGFVAGGNDLLLMNRAMELAAREQLPTFVAIYSMTIQLAAFIAPLASTALADAWGSRLALVAVGVLGLIGAGLVSAVGWGGVRPAAQGASWA